MGIKNVFKWRVTSTKYLYLTDEENKNPFILDKKTGDRIYPLPVSGSTVTGITVVTGMTLDEGLISQTVAQIKNETDYSRKYNRMVELAAYDENASGLTFLDYTKYFNLDGDECIEEAVAPKCEGYEPVFNVSAYTLENGTEVEYSFYADKNESDKTLRYNLTLGIPRGEKGEKGNDGAGCKGEPGDPGLPAIFDDITARIESLEPDEQPTINLFSASTTANTYQLQFDFGVPKGEPGEPGVEGPQGDDGIPARLGGIDIESETLAPGEDAYVQIKDGTYEINRVYDSYEGREFYDTTFTLQVGLPQGIQGIQGIPGDNAEIREVTAEVRETLEAGSEAEAGVDVEPIGGGNVVNLHFWFKIPRGDKGDPGKDGEPGGGGGALYDFDNVVVHETNEPDPYFILHEEPIVISGQLGTKVWLEFYYPSAWSGGGGGGECDIKHRYDYLETGSDSLSEGVEKVVGGVTYPFAIASGSRSHAEGIGYTSSAVLEFLVAGLKNDCHDENIFVMPKEQFIGYVWNSDIIDEEFFKDATFKMPSGIPINANALPAGVTESQFRNSTLKITSCELNDEDVENSYYSLHNVGIEFTVGGQTYQLTGYQFESCTNSGILHTVNSGGAVGENEYVNWRYPITLHLANRSHVEEPNAVGIATHTEGNANFAFGDYSHAEGSGTRVEGVAGHTEGSNTNAYGDYSHAEGFGTTVNSDGGFVGGYAKNNGEIKSGADPDDEYYGTFAHGYADNGIILADSSGSHAEGFVEDGGEIKATGDGSHAEGCAGDNGKITASGCGAHAEGYSSYPDGRTITIRKLTTYEIGKIYEMTGIEFTFICWDNDANEPSDDMPDGGCYGIYDTNDNFLTQTTYKTSYCDRCGIFTKGWFDVFNVENSNVLTSSTTTGTEYKYKGLGTIAKGDGSHAEGVNTLAYGSNSHAEGEKTIAYDDNAHAEGYSTLAHKYGSHIEGRYSIASGDYSHAEGSETVASGQYSHAEGTGTVASGDFSHAEGVGVYKFETDSDNYLHVIVPKQNVVALSGSKKSEMSDVYGIGVDFVEAGNLLTDGKLYEIYANNSFICNMTYSVFDEWHTYLGTYDTGALFTVDNKSALTAALSDGSITDFVFKPIIGAQALASHTEGANTLVTSNASSAHAEGNNNMAIGKHSHVEGTENGVYGESSHAEGEGNTSCGRASHAEGSYTISTGNYAHAEGRSTISKGEGSHAEGYMTSADGNYSHAEGYRTRAQGKYSHAGGYSPFDKTGYGNVIAQGEASFAHGYVNTSSSTIEATSGGSVAFGYAKEGGKIISSGNGSFAHGITSSNDLIASGSGSHAEGHCTQALGEYTHAEGSKTTTNAAKSHAEGANTEANGIASHVEGSECKTTSDAKYAHAEGVKNEAQAEGAHAEGNKTIASGKYSHAGGIGTVANQQGLTVCGKFNKTGTTTDDMFIVGGGTSNSDLNRNNALVVKDSGQLVVPYSTGGLKFESGGSANLVWNSTGGTTDLSGIGGGGRAIQVNGSQILSGDSTTALNLSAGTGISISGTTGGVVTIASTVVNTDTKVTSAANHYGYTSGSGKASGLYKVATDDAGHVTATTAVVKADITALGIPDSDTDTTYKLTLNGTEQGGGTTSLGSFYAPTGGGTSGQYLKSNGNGAPTWDTFPTIPSAPGTLTTTATTSQTTATSESLSGTINLHKISKTGNYNDLLNKPTIPVNTDYQVQQSAITTNAEYCLLAKSISGTGNTTVTSTTIFTTGITINPAENSIYCTGAYYAASDERKKDIVNQISLEKAYELVDKCQTILYTWKNDVNKQIQIGLLAQEVQQYFPELVSEGSDGYLTLDYSKLTVILMTVIKDLTERVKNLETLEERIKRLEEKMN